MKNSYMGDVRSLVTNVMGRTFATSVGAVTYFPVVGVRREAIR